MSKDHGFIVEGHVDIRGQEHNISARDGNVHIPGVGHFDLGHDHQNPNRNVHAQLDNPGQLNISQIHLRDGNTLIEFNIETANQNKRDGNNPNIPHIQPPQQESNNHGGPHHGGPRGDDDCSVGVGVDVDKNRRGNTEVDVGLGIQCGNKGIDIHVDDVKGLIDKLGFNGASEDQDTMDKMINGNAAEMGADSGQLEQLAMQQDLENSNTLSTGINA